jgi:hypothetical protein
MFSSLFIRRQKKDIRRGAFFLFVQDPRKRSQTKGFLKGLNRQDLENKKGVEHIMTLESKKEVTDASNFVRPSSPNNYENITRTEKWIPRGSKNLCH